MSKRTEMLGLPINGYTNTHDMHIQIEELKDANMNLKAEIERLERERAQLRERRDNFVTFLESVTDVTLRTYQKELLDLLLKGKEPLYLTLKPFEGKEELIVREMKRRT